VADPTARLNWYEGMFGGGERSKLKGRIDGLKYGNVWLLAGEPVAPRRRRERRPRHLQYRVAGQHVDDGLSVLRARA